MQKSGYAKNSDPQGGSANKSNKPAGEIRIGMVKATIWERATDDGSYHQVTFSRIYKVGEEWRRADSFNRDDLLVVAKIADLAHSWILEKHQTKTESTQSH